MRLAKGKPSRMVLYGMIGLFLLFQFISVIYARKAALRAQRVVSLLGGFQPGVTSRNDVEKRFLDLGIHLDNLPCSRANAPCEG